MCYIAKCALDMVVIWNGECSAYNREQEINTLQLERPFFNSPSILKKKSVIQGLEFVYSVAIAENCVNNAY